MEQEKKTCGCKNRKWLIPVIALAVVLAVVLVLVLLGNGGGENLYWNVDRMEYAREDREPDANGVYWFRMVTNGREELLQVKDSRLAGTIDSYDAVCLDVNKNGLVTGVSVPNSVRPVARKLYIKHTEGNTVYANNSMALNGMNYTLELTDRTAIYDVMPGTTLLGQRLTVAQLTMADALVAYADETGAITDVFVTARSGSANVYWRLNRQWNAGAKKTARVPDAQGVYTIEMSANGTKQTLKCADEALVNEIDRASDAEAAFCFTINEEGFITRIRDIRVGAHGVRSCAGYVVRAVEGDAFTASDPTNIMISLSTTLPPECGIYDVSAAAFRDGRAGQAVEKLQLGDQIYLWSDADGTPLTVYIRHRDMDVPAYRIYPMCLYDSTTRQTNRVPDQDGWYTLQMIPLGESGIKTYRTQDKALVNFIDSQSATQIVGLRLDGDVITQAYSSSSLYGGSVVNKGRYVAQVVGCMMTVRRIGGRGPAVSMVMTQDCKVYDVSGSGPLGAETELRKGDVIEAQADQFGQISAVIVTRRGLTG